MLTIQDLIPHRAEAALTELALTALNLVSDPGELHTTDEAPAVWRDLSAEWNKNGLLL